jgi:hypothetical protein
MSQKELDGRFAELERLLERDQNLRKEWFGFTYALRCGVRGTEDHAKDAREYAQAHLEMLARLHTGEGSASSMAIIGAASELLGESDTASKTYEVILRLRPDLDNRRGQRWARKRLTGAAVEPDLLASLVRALYPLRTSSSVSDDLES